MTTDAELKEIKALPRRQRRREEPPVDETLPGVEPTPERLPARPPQEDVEPTRRAPPAAVFAGPQGVARRSERELQLQAIDRETQTIAAQEDMEIRKAAYDTVKRLHPLPPQEEALRDKDQAIQDLWNEQAQAIANSFPNLVPGKPPGLAAPREDVDFVGDTFAAFKQKLIEINESPEAAAQFVDDLLQMGQTPDTAIILDIMEIRGELAADFWAQARPWSIVAEELSDAVFPGRELDDVLALAEEDQQGFFDEIRKGPATDDKRELLRHMGYTQPDIEEILRYERMVVPLGGIRTLITVDSNTGRAFDLSNRQVGSYNVMTGELDALPENEWYEDVGNSARVAVTNTWHGGKQAILNYLPEVIDVLIPDMKVAPGMTDLGTSMFVNGMNAYVKGIKDKFRAEYVKNAELHETWFEQHPELQERKEWEEDQWHVGLLADPAYWANEFAKTVPYTVSTMVVQGAATLATGNPLVGFAAGTAFTALITIEDVNAQLIEAGAPEDDAKLWAIPISIVMGSLESAGNLPMLHALSPRISGLFKRQITKELVKRTLPKLIAHKVSKGVITGLSIELGEIITENLQAATIEAGQMIWDEEQGLFEDYLTTTIQTFVATAPFAVIGGGAAMRRAGTSETVGKTDAEPESQGFERDAESGQWFERADLPEAVGDNKGLLSMTPEQVVASMNAVTIPSPIADVGDVGIVTPGVPVEAPAQPTTVRKAPTPSEVPAATARLREVHKQIARDVATQKTLVRPTMWQNLVFAST